MIGHLGARVSALLDGQLPPAEAEEAWEHVYTCHLCRDLVEHEGWVKTRLAGLSGEHRAAPSALKGSLLNLPPGDRFLVEGGPHAAGHPRRGLAVAALGGGAVGAAMVGVLALGLAGSNPAVDRRPPASRIDTPAVTRTPAPTQAPAGTRATSPVSRAPEAVPAWVRDLMP